MPLYTHHRFKLTTLDGFDSAVGSRSCDTEALTGMCHRLMMEAVDEDFLLFEKVVEYRVFLDLYTMGEFFTSRILRMLDMRNQFVGAVTLPFLLDILCHLTP